jgi:hemerythrin
MPFFQWKERYAVGIREIDEQHKELVSLLNELYEAMHAGKGREALGRILTGLMGYTRRHFATEERLMQAHHYPDYPRHKEKHEKMAAKVQALREEYETRQISSPVQISNFLKNWLIKHIQGTDKAFGDYLAERGVR